MQSNQIFCPDCGGGNSTDARFCDACGRSLADVRAARTDAQRPTVGDRQDVEGRLLAADGQPVDDDGVIDMNGERILWEGRPSLLWSPRLSLTQRYKLTTQRLIITFGFIGRRTEEIDLYRVNDVGVKQHPLERITAIGDVYIHASDASTQIRNLQNVSSPDHVKDMIREAARVERQRRRVLLREEFQ